VKLLLDTCVLSEIRNRDGSPAVKDFIAAMPAKALLLSIITVGEITKGIALLPDGRKKRELTAWRLGLCAQFEDRILPLDQESAEIWGELSAAGQKKGMVIPAADGLIAATALRHGLHVVTRNTPHFEAAGAMVVNPWFSPVTSTQ
jgi:predicted nucleic acid-binding protein